jgi:hypothetical protein
MLAGEPPITGPSVQAVIAKLLTEQPTHVRIVRSTIPDGIDAALFKALSKVPADRFGSAGEFARALAVPSTTVPMAVPASSPRRRGMLWAGVLVVAAVAVGFGIVHGRDAKAAPVALRDRTQLTFTGKVETPALSPDKAGVLREELRDRWVHLWIDARMRRAETPGHPRDHRGFDPQWSPDRRSASNDWRPFRNYLISARRNAEAAHCGGAAFYAGTTSSAQGGNRLGVYDQDCG